MTLVDSDDIPDDVDINDTIVVTGKPSHPLIVATNDAEMAVTNNIDEATKTPHDDQLLITPLSNVTASTSNDESLDYSPISNGGSSESPELHTDTFEANAMTTIVPILPTEQAPQPENKLMGSDIITTSMQPLPPASNQNIGANGAKTLYSLRLPGVGKVLAINSNHSCDVDTLYEQEKKACDVDAFVGKEDDDNTDDDDSDLPLYTSTANTMNGNNHVVFNHDELDLEANRASNTSIIRRIDPPLDPNCDPFAQRVGKKLSWRNINMTLVRFISLLHSCYIQIILFRSTHSLYPFRKQKMERKSY